METNRCKLSELQKSDYEDIKRLYINEKVREFLGGTVTEKQYKKGFEAMLQAGEASLYWVVREKASSEFMGLVSLDPHHDGAAIEMSYQFLPQWWGQGYASEIAEFIIDYAFRELRLKKLVSETQTANSASRRLLEKVGMKLEQKVKRFGAEQAIYGILNKLAAE
jgi:[ribosomal protein S5]-alanine N-acetyltransferase